MNIKIILSATILGALFSCYAEAAPIHLDRIVAVVNNEVITQSELDKRWSVIQKQLERVKPESGPVISREQVLAGLIDISLQLQLAKNIGIKIDEKELDSTIIDIAKKHNITVEQLKQSVTEHEGVSFGDFRNQIREQLLIGKTQQQFLGREVTVDDREVATVLRNPPKIETVPAQYHLIDILCEIPESATKEQQKQIANAVNQMATKLKKGGSIEDIVKEGQENFGVQVVSSNDLGWRKIDEMPALFAQEIVKIDVNQIAGPLQAPNGFHLLKLLAINGVSPKASKFTKEQAREVVYQRKFSEKLRLWLQEQREAAYIKITK